jgi:addiction module HigA family antidote
MAFDEPTHPGLYIKQEVLPTDLSVKDAAKLIGVGRPALSNLLNGNASLSPEMAVRIEKAFGAKTGVKSEDLLRKQAEYDQALTGARARELPVRAYARSLMNIKAQQIAGWSQQIEARSLLAALLRHLVNSTGVNLTKVDFPAYDNAQRHGWDGFVEMDSATPWIPRGISGWEFGCDQNPKQKAEDDYAARVASVSAKERKNITFVFVTPKNWPAKNDWTNGKRAERQWKDVRALDASDIEQWLEQSVPAQSWFAEKLHIPTDGILSVEEGWDRWAKVTKPVLSKKLFRGAVDAHGERLKIWLDKKPERPFIIAADSIDEGVAFTTCALEEASSIPHPFAAQAIVIETSQGLKRARDASQNFIAILASPAVETASAGIHQTHHTIILRRRNGVEPDADIVLDLLDNKTFEDALKDMELEEEADRLARESGRSPTILRRRLSQVPAIKQPPWAEDDTTARKLIPIALAGVWNSQTEADQQILHVLAGEPYEKVEENITELLGCDQPPVWSIGRYRGATSKIDALYAVNRLITEADLDNFFFTAQLVLSEEDPALELPEAKRWMAQVYGKVRNHSAALRRGICETLVLLAVHGNNLFKKRLGKDIEAEVNATIRKLLTPPKAETWASQKDDLPRYAEAAPDTFMDILNDDLDQQNPEIQRLLGPASTDFGGGGCPRAGLLWALENLAWRPEHLLPVATILCKLSRYPINDNWSNKPEGTLNAIFRSWMPQTAANVERRIAVVEKLAKTYPDVIWQLLISQLDRHSTIGTYNHRPEWRNDASGAGQPVSGQENYDFLRKALGIVISWPDHDERTLGDLVAQLTALPPEDQEKIWKKIEAWAASESDESKKATLRERIRINTLTRRGRKHMTEGTRERAAQVYDSLRAKDLVVRHQWLFAKTWVEESYEELEQDNFDFKKREERVAKLRKNALREVWNDSGYEGIRRLCLGGEAGGVMGWLLADGIVPARETNEFLSRLAAEPKDKLDANIDNCIGGFLAKLTTEKRVKTLGALIKQFSSEGDAGEERTIRLLRCAPFDKETWQQVDALRSELRKRYWQEVYPRWQQQGHEEINEMIERLLDTNRPRSAFATVRYEFKEIETQNLVHLLTEVAINDSEPSGTWQIDGYSVGEAFKVLSGRGVPEAELARLEFLFLGALEDSKYGIPNLERELVKSPSFFMEALALIYRRDDGGEDPPEWRRPDNEARSSVATQAYRLLQSAKRIPGTQDDGTIKAGELKNWIVEVLTLSKKFGRLVVGEHAVGHLLAKSKPGADGIWPSEPIREVLEEVGTKEIAVGMSIGLYNSRGVHARGPGGDQERELAAKYRGWSKTVAVNSPFTARLLEEIARTYDREAEWHDTDADIRKRLPY